MDTNKLALVGEKLRPPSWGLTRRTNTDLDPVTDNPHPVAATALLLKTLHLPNNQMTKKSVAQQFFFCFFFTDISRSRVGSGD